MTVAIKRPVPGTVEGNKEAISALIFELFTVMGFDPEVFPHPDGASVQYAQPDVTWRVDVFVRCTESQTHNTMVATLARSTEASQLMLPFAFDASQFYDMATAREALRTRLLCGHAKNRGSVILEFSVRGVDGYRMLVPHMLACMRDVVTHA